MKLTVLTDNHTHIDQYYLGEPALCFHIETDGRKILLDTGYSDVCLRNSQAMGIDLRQVDTITTTTPVACASSGTLASWRARRC